MDKTVQTIFKIRLEMAGEDPGKWALDECQKHGVFGCPLVELSPNNLPQFDFIALTGARMLRFLVDYCEGDREQAQWLFALTEKVG